MPMDIALAGHFWTMNFCKTKTRLDLFLVTASRCLSDASPQSQQHGWSTASAGEELMALRAGCSSHGQGRQRPFRIARVNFSEHPRIGKLQVAQNNPLQVLDGFGGFTLGNKQDTKVLV